MDTNLPQRHPVYPVRPVANMAGPAPNITIKPRTTTTAAPTPTTTTTTATTTTTNKIDTPTTTSTTPTASTTTTTPTTTTTAIAQRRAYMLLPIKDAAGTSTGAPRVVAPNNSVANQGNQLAIAVRQPAQPQQPVVIAHHATGTATATARNIANTTTAPGPTPTKKARIPMKRGPYKKRTIKRVRDPGAALPLPNLASSPEHSATASEDESPPVELNRRQDNPNSNFTTSERTFVLMALAIARDRLDIKPNWHKPREGFGTHLCQEVREILDERSFRHVVRKSANYVNGERKSPSDNVIRDIWTNFLKNGTPARVSRGGRRKNEEARVQIKELLESGNYSSREVAAMTGVSRALVCNAIKEFKGKARKAARASKATDAANTPDGEDAASDGQQLEQQQQPPQPKPKARRGRPRKTNLNNSTANQMNESILQNSDGANISDVVDAVLNSQQQHAMHAGDMAHYSGYC